MIGVVDKETDAVQNIRITDYEEGSASASTPHLVKTGDNSFVLLWSREDNVYYTALDGEGNPDEIYTIENASLSDCVPIVADGELVWYTWNNKVNTFCDIDLTDFSQHSQTVIENGHRMEVTVTPTEPGGDCTMECTECEETVTFATPTSAGLYWAVNKGDSYSRSVSVDLHTGAFGELTIDTIDPEFLLDLEKSIDYTNNTLTFHINQNPCTSYGKSAAIIITIPSQNYEDMELRATITMERGILTAEDFIFSAEDTVYSGTAKTAVLTPAEDVLELGEIKLTYYDENGDAIEPVTIGTYFVKAEINGGEYYESAKLETPDWTFTITPAVPEVAEPTAKAVVYGQSLADATLTKGWAWADDSILPTVKNDGFKAVFAVADAENYNEATGTMVVMAETTTTETTTTTESTTAVVGYTYVVETKAPQFYFSHDKNEFQPEDLIERITRYAVYSDGSTSENGEILENFDHVDFSEPTPEFIWNGDSYWYSLSVTIEDDFTGQTIEKAVDICVGVKGDANLDGTADAKDAAAILTYAAAAGAGQSIPLYSADDRTMEDLAFYLAEVNTSGDADAKDAALILAYAAAAGSGEPKTWEEILGAA